MLTLLGREMRLCDGIARRGFWRLAPRFRRADAAQRVAQRAAQSAGQRRDTAVILYWMAGGPSHIDTYDMKPDAPAEVRGPFRAGAARECPG